MHASKQREHRAGMEKLVGPNFFHLARNFATLLKHSEWKRCKELKCTSNWLYCASHLSPSKCYEMKKKICAKIRKHSIKIDPYHMRRWTNLLWMDQSDRKNQRKKIDHSLCEINYYIREPHKIDRNTCCYQFMQFMCVHVLVEHEQMTEWEVAVEYIMCAPLCIRCMSTLACLADIHKCTHPRAYTFISEGMKICFKNNMHFGW